jgi:hypothetical protein
MDSWIENVARMRKMRNAYKIIVGKPEGNTPLGRRKYRLCNNVDPLLDNDSETGKYATATAK